MKNGIFKILKLSKQEIKTVDSFLYRYILNAFYFIILFSSISLFEGALNSEIHLISEGSGNYYILSQDFYGEPFEVWVNGQRSDSCNKLCNFIKDGYNNVTIKFNVKINSCQNMFKNLMKIIEIDLSSFDTSNVENMNNMFYQCTNLRKINFGNIDTSLVKDMSAMFSGCRNLIYIDLSKFDTSSVTNMVEMFKNCKKLKSVDASSFNTKKVVDMFDLFGECHELLTVNLSSFDTSKVTRFHGMFFHCYKLKYIDIKNFVGPSTTEIGYMFDSCKLIFLNMKSFKIDTTKSIERANTAPNELKYLCLEDTSTLNYAGFKISNRDCSNICFRKNIKVDIEEKKCYESCGEKGLNYEYNNICMNNCPDNTYKILKNTIKCSEIIPENYYLETNSNIYKECYTNCKSCNGPGSETNNNCKECKNDFIFLDDSLAIKKNCYKKCKFYYYFGENNNYKCTETDSCPNNYKLILQKNKCIDECKNNKNSLDLFEFNNNCVEECPKNTKIDKETNKCLESCDETKFEYQNYCWIDCPDGTYKIFTNRNICVESKPENYYYLDSRTEIYQPCHDNCLNCSGPGDDKNNNCIECKQNFFSIDKPNKGKHCLNCQYNYYIHNQKYFCTENSTCPEDYSKIIKEKNQCIDNCINDDIYQYEYNNRCYKICPNGTNYINNNKICYDNDETIENIIQNEISRTREYLKSGKMNSTDYIMNIFNVTIQITNSENQKSNTQKNMSSIDLDKCENELRSIYGINDTLPLIIFKIDYFSNYSLIPIIGYEIYNPNNLLMLNLSYCTNNTIKVNIPANIDENNLFKYDPSNSFYKNNCHSYTTENGTDIPLKDRQKEYKDKNMSLCEYRCKYLGYDVSNKQSSCICEIKNQMETISKIKDNPKKLSDDFSDYKHSSSSSMISTECTYICFIYS